MTEDSPTQVLDFMTSKIFFDVAKVSIKSEKLTPLGKNILCNEAFFFFFGRKPAALYGFLRHLKPTNSHLPPVGWGQPAKPCEISA